nr:helix-turn-helix transcriptional regulator [uncultured Blautia sp.]
MIETTGTLFNKLNNRKNGEALLSQKQTAPTCARLLREILEKAKMSVSEWIAGANISKSYGYQILRGERTPGRDILLRTALVVQLSLKDTQRLLAVGGCGALYPKVRRDAVVIFALNQKMTLLETEELISSLPERSLFDKEK